MEIICYAMTCSFSILCCTVTSIAIQHENELAMERNYMERNYRIDSNIHQYEEDTTELDSILFNKVNIVV
jgi:hypothetical protein